MPQKPQIGRTSVGNILTDKQAHGYAISMIRQVKKRSDIAAENAKAHKPRQHRPASQRDRMVIINNVKENYAHTFLRTIIHKRALRARMLFLSGIGRRNSSGDALVITQTDFNFTDKHIDQYGSPLSHCVIAGIEAHLLARIMQRSTRRTLDDMRQLLDAAASWSSVPSRLGLAGTWMMPTEDGLICAQAHNHEETDTDSRWVAGVLSNMSIIKTFISSHDMSHNHQQARARLVAAGALMAPAFPTYDHVTAEQLQVWKLMREEGAAWEARRGIFAPQAVPIGNFSAADLGFAMRSRCKDVPSVDLGSASVTGRPNSLPPGSFFNRRA